LKREMGARKAPTKMIFTYGTRDTLEPTLPIGRSALIDKFCS
jgi:hypothetical protein